MSIDDTENTPPQETTGEYIKRMVAEALAEGRTNNPEGDPTKPGPSIPVPKIDHPPENADEATALGKMFAEYRAEVAALRQELQAHRPRVVQVGVATETLGQRAEARLAQIADSSHYCPGCGTLSKYPRLCVGPDPAHPSHAAIEMVSTDELGGDPAKHAKAPSTDPDQPDLVAA